MNANLLHVLRMLIDKEMLRPPLTALQALRRKGIQRLPAPIDAELGKGRPRLKSLRFVLQWLDGEQLTRHNGQWVLNSFIPPFPGVAYERMFNNLLSGRRLSPVSAFLAVTSDCPYNCWHCSLHGREHGNLNSSIWLSAIDQLHTLGASIIGFTGGEPLCRSELDEMIRAASAGGAATILFSSGAGLDETRAKELRNAGLWSVCISLDGVKEEEVDAKRGHKGAYQQALRAIRIARKENFYTMIGAVAIPQVVRENQHERLHNLAHDLGVHELRFVEPMPCGKLTGIAKDQLLSPNDLKVLREFHKRQNRRGANPKICAFNQVESPEVFGCGAGTQHLFIDPAGNVCPCDFTPLGFGSIAEEPLSSIWERMSSAMGGYPRKHCFIQHNADLVCSHSKGLYPLAVEDSEAVCSQAPHDGLPGYFDMILGGKGNAR